MTFSLSAMTVRGTTTLLHFVDSPYSQFIFLDKEADEGAVFGLKAFQLFE